MVKKTGRKKTARKGRSDKRQHARVPLKARVDYELLSEDTFLFEYTSNLSRGGIFLATRNPLPIGTRLHLRFTLPDENNRVIKTTGKVAWVNPYHPHGPNLNPGMGVEFIDLSPEDLEAISRLVRRIALLTEE
jgi:type IV pilus assembly protein PilZ